MSDEVEKSKGSGLGPLLTPEEGRKRLEDYARSAPVEDEHTALCREVREMLGDTPEEAECGCKAEAEKHKSA